MAGCNYCLTVILLLSLPDQICAGIIILTTTQTSSTHLPKSFTTLTISDKSRTNGHPNPATSAHGGDSDTAQNSSATDGNYPVFNVSQCISEQVRSRKLFQERVEVFYAFNSSETDTFPSRSCLLVFTVPRGMIVQMTKGQMTEGACKDLYVELYEIQQMCVVSLFRCSLTLETGVHWDTKTLPVVQSNTNVVRVQFSHHTQALSFFLRFRLTALPAPNKSQLELLYDTNSRGWIQTPHHGSLRPYPAGMSSEVTLTVPTYHLLMFTFLHMDIEGVDGLCEGDGVCLYIRAERHLLSCHCEDIRTDPQLSQAHMFHVHFVSYRPQGNYTGFKLHFSFHRVGLVPHGVSSGQWNCSVPYWSDFKAHFACNLVMDCLEGEDEWECPYFSTSCPHAHFSAGKSCFRYFVPDEKLTWFESEKACRRQKSHLASFNTPEEWHDVIKSLRLRSRSVRVTKVYIGLRYSGDSLPHTYHRNLQWMDSTIALFVRISPYYTGRSVQSSSCGHLAHRPLYEGGPDQVVASVGRCDLKTRAVFLCEPNKMFVKTAAVAFPKLVSETFSGISYLVCTVAHVTHQFLACDAKSACFCHEENHVDVTSCRAPLMPLPPSMTCRNKLQMVPFSLVCDHQPDCIDNSDEDFCLHEPCPMLWFYCGGRQCVERTKRCDSVRDCTNGHDELLCASENSRSLSSQTLPPPAVVHYTSAFDSSSPFTVKSLNRSTRGFACPDSHFQCSDNGYCLPVFVRCNGVHDCPTMEDEADCERYTCPGFYRCRGSRVCLHPQHVCDKVHHCSLMDDELYCHLTCPHHCTCYGLAYFCKGASFSVLQLSDVRSRVRFLDVSETVITVEDVANFTKIVHLGLSGCFLSVLSTMHFDNLRSLDLSDNLLRNVNGSHFSYLHNLLDLSLAGNPLSLIYSDLFSATFPTLRSLDLSGVSMQEITSTFSSSRLQRLEHLNLSHTGIASISGVGLKRLTQLSVIDLRGCPVIHFSRDLFQLDRLQVVHADNYKLCCPAVLPSGFNLNKCLAPQDEISSCEDLLRSNVYRVFLFLFSFLGMFGNLGSFLYRFATRRNSINKAFHHFVTHLSVADFWMGVYLAIIGTADLTYKGGYAGKDEAWRHSTTCQAAGFLSLLSSEVSAFIICLITLDRFVVLRFPLSGVRFGMTSAHVALCVTWCVGLTLAAVPIFPITSHWKLYSQNAICVPLPVRRRLLSGHQYSFGILVVMNLVLFLLIAVGQLSIYWSVRDNRMTSHNHSRINHRFQDLKIARRLITIAMSDFLCWFPVGLLGLMASQGLAIPGEVNVTLAIFVLPLNSALNPFIYTLNVILERRQKARDERLRQFLLSQAKHNKK